MSESNVSDFRLGVVPTLPSPMPLPVSITVIFVLSQKVPVAALPADHIMLVASEVCVSPVFLTDLYHKWLQYSETLFKESHCKPWTEERIGDRAVGSPWTRSRGSEISRRRHLVHGG